MPVAITKPLRGVKPRRGWRHTGWRNCDDINNETISGCPRYLRCYTATCNKLVTHGQVASGGCECGQRKMYAAMSLSLPEILLLKVGWFELADWEKDEIKPICDLSKVRAWVYERL